MDPLEEATVNITYPSEPVHRTEYDDREDLSFVVIDAVAIASGSSHAEIGPLNDVLGPEALCDLFAPRTNGQGRSGGVISFHLDGYRVVIDAATREVRVYE
ncbi:hypothetical protein HAPAU_03260 [Halalkalicoccus paucihalophilus]|uniref:Halobacterial output domain-containing protein n=1 Tax=Halalkalicoccus paucihalophilus TaxID=1008153 RepID=A0A151AJ15_9EURY|nr:hypothetical protein HAPAU_03260 [Halalkalicoccus paucihalophilus]